MLGSIARSHSAGARSRPSLALRISGVITAGALAALALLVLQPAPPAAAATTAQCDGEFNVGGEGLDCRITVENFLDLATGEASSRVTTLACSGAANVDPLPACVGPTVTEYPELTTSADQCNGSANGGGSSMLCSVTVVNTITGDSTTMPAVINQCNDSLTTGDVRACTPDPATADASTDGVTQCNGSVNGGGGSMTCSVSPSSTSNSAFAFIVNQCNDSANGGGARIVCTVDISTVVLEAAAPQPSAPPGPSAPPVDSATPTEDELNGGEELLAESGSAIEPPTMAALGFAALALLALGLLASRTRDSRAAVE